MSPDVVTARPHRARRGEGEQLRGEVMDAAEELLLQKGSKDAVSIRAIAQRVGVTPPSIYLHFADKDDLFFEVCDRRFAAMSEAVIAGLEESDDPVDQALALGRAYIRWGLTNPAHYAVLFGGDLNIPEHVDPATLQGRRALEVFAGVVRRGIEAGVFASELDPVAATVMMWSTVHGFVDIATVKQEFVPDIDLAALESQVLELAIRGLRA